MRYYEFLERHAASQFAFFFDGQVTITRLNKYVVWISYDNRTYPRAYSVEILGLKHIIKVVAKIYGWCPSVKYWLNIEKNFRFGTSDPMSFKVKA